MAERKRLGLIFTVNPNWMGGTYYILNLINSFNYLQDAKKPEVTLLCSDKSDYDYAIKYTSYPYLNYKIFIKRRTLFKSFINKITRSIFGKNIISPYIKVNATDFDAIYPIKNVNHIIPGTLNIGWIPDFQEKYLPNFFSKETINLRNRTNSELAKSGLRVVLSSVDSQKDYIKFYKADEINSAVFRFSSKIPKIQDDYLQVLEKYGVEEDKYLFCSNQFWIHKNHLVLFRAIKILKSEGTAPTLICTGNPNDNRAIGYFKMLRKFIEENNLQENIRILGLIDRNEQLTLMKCSKCIVQPSLFEGWNTSIEEAKAMNKLLIVSDLDVHKEQVERNGLFFKRDSAEDLAEKINAIVNDFVNVEQYDYSNSIKKSAESFMSIIERE